MLKHIYFLFILFKYKKFEPHECSHMYNINYSTKLVIIKDSKLQKLGTIRKANWGPNLDIKHHIRASCKVEFPPIAFTPILTSQTIIRAMKFHNPTRRESRKERKIQPNLHFNNFHHKTSYPRKLNYHPTQNWQSKSLSPNQINKSHKSPFQI